MLKRLPKDKTIVIYNDNTVVSNTGITKDDDILKEWNIRAEEVKEVIKSEYHNKSKTILRTQVEYGKLRGNEYSTHFKMLKLLHSICPDYVVNPIRTIENRYGIVSDYEMELIYGYNLNKLRNDLTRNETTDILLLDRIVKDLPKVIKKFHDNNLVHGDLHSRNIIFTKDSFKIIDPIPHAYDNLSCANYVLERQREDKNQLRHTLRWIKEIKKSLTSKDKKI